MLLLVVCVTASILGLPTFQVSMVGLSEAGSALEQVFGPLLLLSTFAISGAVAGALQLWLGGQPAVITGTGELRRRRLQWLVKR